MNKTISMAALIAGIALIVFGVSSMDSFSSDVSRFFTGSPTNKSIWLLIAGIIASVIGLAGMARGSKHA